MWKQIGKVPSLEEALELVLLHRTRYGRGVRSQSPALEAARSESNRAILEQNLEELSREASDLAASPTLAAERRLRQIEFQRQILTAMTKFGDRRIHATELAAALVLVHGLNSEKLRPFFTAAARLEQKAKPPFDGSMATNLHVLKNNMLQRVYERLAQERGYYATGQDLKRELRGGEMPVKTSLAILDLAGAVHKLPIDSATQSMVWMHAGDNPPEPWWNNYYRILAEMERRGTPVTRKLFIKKSRIGGGECPIANVQSVRLAFHALEKSGLVEEASRPARGRPLFKLTDRAREWVAETRRTGVLHPRLREALLGTVEAKPSPLSPWREQQLLEEIRIRLLFEKNPERTLASIAKELQVPPTSVSACVRRGMSTFKTFSTPNLLKIASFFEGKGLVEEADYLRRFTAAKEVGKFFSR